MNVNEAREKIQEMFSDAESSQKIENLRVEIFGKKGYLASLKKEIINIPPEERKSFGLKINEVKNFAQQIFDEKKKNIEEKELQKKIEDEKIDVTLPGKYIRKGSIHPITRVLDEFIEIFKVFGFSVADGPEIERDDYNFDRLNIPPNHPARGMADTFHMKHGYVLRTHTSPVQVRTMLSQKPPVKIIAPGRVYRKDTPDATHTPVFHQIEGLYVDKGVTFADLKAILAGVLKNYYGEEIEVKFQPSYFPFTEPSAEVYITCNGCMGKGCSTCKGAGFIEVLGCGMVHPNVLKMADINPDVYTGWAFGMGVERLALRGCGISDIRYFYENDYRFLKKQ
ncbi:MAG: phenylalanine--tRNA ligase subunit alpha [Candidatus Muiribacteriota bacterium]